MRRSYNGEFSYILNTRFETINEDLKSYQPLNNFKVDAVYYGQYPGPNDHVASGKKLKTSCLQVSSFFERMELGPIGRFLRSRGKSASGDGGGDKKDNVSRDFT